MTETSGMNTCIDETYGQFYILHYQNDKKVLKALFAFSYLSATFTTFSALTNRFASPSDKCAQTDVFLFALSEDEGIICLLPSFFQPICLFLSRLREFTNTLLIQQLCAHK